MASPYSHSVAGDGKLQRLRRRLGALPDRTRFWFLAGGIAAVCLLPLLVIICWPSGGPGHRRLAAAGPKTRWDPSVMEDVDGRKLPEDKKFPKQDVVKRWRPWTADDDGGTLEVEDLHIHHVINQKAIDIGLVSHDRVPNKTITYSKVFVRNCEINDIVRDAVGQNQGIHIDFLRICGGGDQQPQETDVVIEDVYIHDGSALPIMIQDGKYRSITLRRIRIENTTLGGVQIAMTNTGYAKDILVEDCPGLGVALMGRPGSIERCVVRNSPNNRVSDVRTVNGSSGVKITTEDTGAKPLVPKPATTSKPVVKPPKLVVTGDPNSGAVHVALAGEVPEDLAFVVFEAFDKDEYRCGQPVIVTEAPWQADLKLTRLGPVRIQAIVRHPTGDSDAPLVQGVTVNSLPK